MANDLHDNQKDRVFISYSRHDEVFVNKLYRDLKAKEIKPWLDVKDIEGGANWVRKIQNALKFCDAMVSVISSHSIKSKAAENEWNYFYLGLEKPLVPILIEEIEVGDLPWYLMSLNYIDFTSAEHYDGKLEELVETLIDNIDAIDGLEHLKKLRESSKVVEAEKLERELEKELSTIEPPVISAADDAPPAVDSAPAPPVKESKPPEPKTKLPRSAAAPSKPTAAPKKPASVDPPTPAPEPKEQWEIKTDPVIRVADLEKEASPSSPIAFAPTPRETQELAGELSDLVPRRAISILQTFPQDSIPVNDQMLAIQVEPDSLRYDVYRQTEHGPRFTNRHALMRWKIELTHFFKREEDALFQDILLNMDIYWTREREHTIHDLLSTMRPLIKELVESFKQLDQGEIAHITLLGSLIQHQKIFDLFLDSLKKQVFLPIAWLRNDEVQYQLPTQREINKFIKKAAEIDNTFYYYLITAQVTNQKQMDWKRVELLTPGTFVFQKEIQLNIPAKTDRCYFLVERTETTPNTDNELSLTHLPDIVKALELSIDPPRHRVKATIDLAKNNVLTITAEDVETRNVQDDLVSILDEHAASVKTRKPPMKTLFLIDGTLMPEALKRCRTFIDHLIDRVDSSTQIQEWQICFYSDNKATFDLRPSFMRSAEFRKELETLQGERLDKIARNHATGFREDTVNIDRIFDRDLDRLHWGPTGIKNIITFASRVPDHTVNVDQRVRQFKQFNWGAIWLSIFPKLLNSQANQKQLSALGKDLFHIAPKALLDITNHDESEIFQAFISFLKADEDMYIDVDYLTWPLNSTVTTG